MAFLSQNYYIEISEGQVFVNCADLDVFDLSFTLGDNAYVEVHFDQIWGRYDNGLC